MHSVVPDGSSRQASASMSAIQGTPLRMRRGRKSRFKEKLHRGVHALEELFVSDDCVYSDKAKAIFMGFVTGFIVTFVACCKGESHHDCSAVGCFWGVGIVAALFASSAYYLCMVKARESEERVRVTRLAAQLHADEFDLTMANFAGNETADGVAAGEPQEDRGE